MSTTQPTSEAFAELALPLFDSLYNFARWLTRDTAEAEDLVQETYAKALRGFASFEPGTDFRAWVYRILRNTFLNTRTGLKAAATVPFDEEKESTLPPDPETPETILLMNADRQIVRDALDALPVHFREIILLCDVEEMSYKEIAAALGAPIGTVMSRLARARKALGAEVKSRMGRV